MNAKEAIQYMHENTGFYLSPDNSGKGYRCPICGSGSGKNGTGITTKDGIHFTCWAGCFTNADIIDIIGTENHLTDNGEKLRAAARAFGIPLEGTEQADGAPVFSEPVRPSGQPKQAPAPQKETSAPSEADYSTFFLQAHKNIDKTTYHRGISLDTLNRFKIGYVENWTHPNAHGAPPSPRLIIPTSRHSYLARDTRDNLTEEQKKYAKQKVGAVQLFNIRALAESEKPVFIVEGEIDALSIIDADGAAVALGSTSNVGKLLDCLKGSKPLQPLILSLDNDAAGQKASAALESGLKELGITFYRLDICNGCKDANEAYNADRERFRQAVRRADQIEEIERERKKKAIAKTSAGAEWEAFWNSIESSVYAPCYGTGFLELDKLLDGGLFPGLYIVGAISSLGKTTFCLQIADQIAADGYDVLIFSLEMGKYELIAKSLSRLTAKLNREKSKCLNWAKTTRAILNGAKHKSFSEAEKDLLADAKIAYLKYAWRIFIVEGVGDVTAARIAERVKEHIAVTGKAPAVLIDYLQIIAPTDIRASDKQNTDKAVLELKRLSRDCNIPIIGISSFNRDNYTAPVNMASFKESGAIEYSSDVLIGLQYKDMDFKPKEKEGERVKRLREDMRRNVEKASRGEAIEIELKVLKNRNGRKGSVFFDFYPMFNLFQELKQPETWEDVDNEPF